MVYLRGKTWWVRFTFNGRQIRESAKTTRKTIATEYERKRLLELEREHAGLSPCTGKKAKTVAEAIDAYNQNYAVTHRPRAARWSHDRLRHPRAALGSLHLTQVTEERIRSYMAQRMRDSMLDRKGKYSGRTINMEVAELSRAMGSTWGRLWPKVRKLEEREDVGRALGDEEQRRLILASDLSRSPHLGGVVRIALLTAMRSDEIRTLQWKQIDFGRRSMTVGTAKTAAGTGRLIPLEGALLGLLDTHREWCCQQFGEVEPEHYLFAYGKRGYLDPARPTTTLKTAWNSARKHANVACRFHDLRHTVLSRWAEASVPEATMKALAGHMSAKMLERYSHVRVDAKRKAMQTIQLPGAEPETDGTSTKSGTITGSDLVQ